jgi:hypothetical protein
MLLVRESIARGAGDEAHRATLAPEDVATLVKVSPALMQREFERGMLQASKIGQVYRITQQDLQMRLEQKRPNHRLWETRR